ncbi:hypothetical protein GGR52DRAFT_544823 [Hypoxylon sp. FL1284]|nr:hypothetical protein GGR52DRAFT_544823 [Hypoxylon sp. FL1284]
MARNGDIRGFFGRPAGSNPGSPQLKRDSPLQLPVSSPITPPKPTPKRRDVTDEIRGSDDEEDDSDDSLESLSVFYTRKGPAPHQRDHTLTSTPKAKRVASTNLKSPLTLQPKHQFDLKHLVDHARQSARAEESARRADALINQSDSDDGHSKHLAEVQKNPELLEKTARNLLNSDEEDAKGGKLMRAMNRTRAEESQRRHYFFDLEQSLVRPPRHQFPRKAARGCWKCLADSRARAQAFIIGLPHTIVSKGRPLPDELFLWVLDEVCVEKNAQLRLQYCNLVALCPDSIARLVTEAQLYSMLERLGGPKYHEGHQDTKLPSFPRVEDPYRRKDWAGLVAFLELLERMAPNLSTPNVVDAIQLLLRMALDPLVSAKVRAEHLGAMEALVAALPRPSTPKWNEACKTISSYLYNSVDEPVHQVIPISYMPKTGAKAVELRRRMAAVILLRDPEMGGQAVGSTLTLKQLTSRLDSADFSIGPSTDYEALRALVTLLDVVLGNLDFVAQKHFSSTPSTTAPAERSAADRSFDAAVDGLARRLKALHDKILDSTLLSRKVAKASIDLVAKRLTYAVRTRPPPKTSIFDAEPRRPDDPGLPRQRDFMKNWARKKAEQRSNNNNNAAAANGSGGVGNG